MAKYKFSIAAEEDLESIVDYTLQNWGIDQANQYLDGLEQRAQSLADNPKTGTSCEDFGVGLRYFPYQSHALYYLKEQHGITIVRVLHESMSPELHLKDDS